MDRSSLRDFAKIIEIVEVIAFLLLLYYLTRLRIVRFHRRDAFPRSSSRIDKLKDKPDNIKTVRVQGIPEDWNSNQLQEHLQSAYGECTLHSLAPTGRKARTACATITFENLPALFKHQCPSCRNMEYDFDFEGMTPLFEPKDAGDEIVDIIAVPGVVCPPFETWQSPTTAKSWLRDFIPQSLQNTRVLLYGYKLETSPDDYKSQVAHLAKALLESVKTIRRPIIFIGHELGVTLIKEMLCLAAETYYVPENDNLYKCTFGLLFFGDPKMGFRDNELPEIGTTQAKLRFLRDLFVNQNSKISRLLTNIPDNFAEFHQRLQVQTFYRRRDKYYIEPIDVGCLNMAGRKTLMMTENSAAAVDLHKSNIDFIALDKNHFGPVQFQSVHDEAFTVVETKIRKLVEHATGAIEATFAPRLSMAQKQLLCHTALTQNKRIRNMIGQHIAGTLAWSDNNQTIASWKTASTSCSLVITGSPGQGKSVLCNKILHDLETELRNMSVNSKVIYCFCSDDRPAPLRNSETILRTFILQLITESQLCDDLQQIYQTWNELDSASLQELWSTFLILLGNTSHKQIFCIIDGLDELVDSCSDELLYFIQDLLSAPEPLVAHLRFKLLLSSRPEKYHLGSLEATFLISLSMSQEDLNHMIESYADGLNNGVNEPLRKYIKDEMRRQGGSSPLLINIIMKEIASISFPNEDKVKLLIKNSPSKLSELYKVLANKICEQDEPARLLAWVVYTKRALSLKEHEIALAIQPEVDLEHLYDLRPFRTELTELTVRSYAGSLLEIYEGHVYLVHKSLRDFLTSVESPLRQSVRWKHGCPELHVAESCIRFLTLQDFGSEEILEDLNAYFSQQHTDARTEIFMGDITLDTNLTDRIDVNYIVNKSLSTAEEQGNNSEEEFARKSFFAYASQYWYRHITSIKMATFVWDPICALLDASSVWSNSWFHMVNSFRVSKQIHMTTPQAFVATALDIGWLAAMAFLEAEGNLEASFPLSYLTYAAATGRNVIEALLPHIVSHSSKLGLEALAPRLAVAAANNAIHGVRITELLLMQLGVRITLTLDLVQAAAENFGCGKQVLALVLGSQRQKFFISHTMVDCIAENFDDSILYMLLKHRHAVFRVTTVAIKRVTNPVRSNDLLRKDWSRQGARYVQPRISAREEIFRNELHEEILPTTFINGDRFEITEEVISAAAGNEYHGEELMNSLFECRDQDVNITENVLLAAILNKVSGLEVIKSLMEKRPHEVAITEDVVEATTLNKRFGSTMLALLLDNPVDGAKIDIPTFNLLVQQFNGDFIQPMLEQRQFGFQLTPVLIDRILDSCRIYLKKRVMQILIERHASNISDYGCLAYRMVQWNCRKGLKTLIQRQILDASIFHNCLRIAWDRQPPSWKTIKLLIRETVDGTTITEYDFTVAAQRFGRNEIKGLVQYYPNLKTDKSMIDAALASVSEARGRSLKLALEQSGCVFAQDSRPSASSISGVKQNPERNCICLDTTSCIQTSARVNRVYGQKIVELISRSFGPAFPVFKATIKLLVLEKTRDNRFQLRHELTRQLPYSKNTSQLLLTNSTCNKGLLELISREEEHRIIITGDLIVAGLRWNRKGVEGMTRNLLLCDDHGFHITPRALAMLLKRIKLNGEQIKALQTLTSEPLSVTPAVWEHLATNTPSDETVLMTLLHALKVDERVMSALIVGAAANAYYRRIMLSMLMTTCPGRESTISTTSILKDAAENRTCDVMEATLEILATLENPIEVEDEVIAAIARQTSVRDELMAVLLTYRHQIRDSDFLITRFIQARLEVENSYNTTILAGISGCTSDFGTNEESLMDTIPSFLMELESEEDMRGLSQQHLKVLNCENVVTALDTFHSFERRNFRTSLRRR